MMQFGWMSIHPPGMITKHRTARWLSWSTKFDVTTANLLAQNHRSFTAGYLLVPMAAEMSSPKSQTDGEMGNRAIKNWLDRGNVFRRKIP